MLLLHDHTFKKAHQVVTMDSKQLGKVDGEFLPVDPQLLFQRLVTAASGNPEDMEDLFRYKLSGHPSAIFEPSGLFCLAQKSVLADVIWTTTKGTEMPTPQLDGEI